MSILDLILLTVAVCFFVGVSFAFDGATAVMQWRQGNICRAMFTFGYIAALSLIIVTAIVFAEAVSA